MPFNKTYLILFIAVAAAYLWLVSGLPVPLLMHAAHDDQLYVKMALKILRGEWLGEYNELTLLKEPFYSVWLAFNYLTGAPVLLGQGILYVAAGALFIKSIAPHVRHQGIRLLIYTFYLFNPMVYTMNQTRMVREGLFIPLTVLVVSMTLIWFNHRNSRWKSRVCLAIWLGLALMCFWITRMEGVWILPIFPFVLTALVWTKSREKGFSRNLLKKKAALALIPIAIVYSGIHFIAGINYLKYGVYDVVEFKQKEFISAYGALSRVKNNRERFIVIPSEAREKAYEVSPAFKELQPYLEGPSGKGWAAEGCRTNSINPCDGKIRSSHFIFALRSAVKKAGYYRSATKTRDFYARIAEEINTACDNESLDCNSYRSTLAPVFYWEYVGETISKMSDAIQFLFSLQDISVSYGSSTGSFIITEFFSGILNSDIYLDQDQLVIHGKIESKLEKIKSIYFYNPSNALRRTTLETRVSQTDNKSQPIASSLSFYLRTNCITAKCRIIILGEEGEIASESLDKFINGYETPELKIERIFTYKSSNFSPPGNLKIPFIINSLKSIGEAYRISIPYIAWPALAIFFFSLGRALLNRRFNELLAVNSILLIAVASRLLMLSYLTVTSFPGIVTRFVGPAYPLFFLFCGLCLFDGGNQLWDFFKNKLLSKKISQENP